MMENNVFKSSDGMLTVEKNASVARTYSMRPEEITMNYNDLLDTAFSYMEENIQIADNGNQECAFCGEPTGYANRHVCKNCWRAREHNILRILKEQTANKIVRI